jgi:putative membrane protein
MTTALAALAGAPGSVLARVVEEGSTTLSSQVAAAAGLAALLAYSVGAWRQWPGQGRRGVPASEALLFLAGIIGLWAATSGTLHALGRWSLAAHMGQHMLLFAYVPALLVAARPGRAFAHALPHLAPRAGVGAQDSRLAGTLVAATAVHSMVMWFWHHPAAISTTLLDDRLQLAMHASFVLSGLWFWSALLGHMRHAAAPVGTAMLALVTIMMQMGLLGALLTFSPRVLYPICSERAPLLGLEPISDQQLAGLIMWVPACLPYLLGALWLMQRWFRQGDTEAQH